MKIHPIGIVHSPYTTKKGTPIQPSSHPDVEGKIEIYPEFLAGLQDLKGFSHIMVIFYFHKISVEKLQVIPYLDTNLRGVYATRAPSRPNHLGLSFVRLKAIDNNFLTITPIDMLNKTPVLDIKPFIPQFDLDQIDLNTVSIGWLASCIQNRKTTQDDGRFS